MVRPKGGRWLPRAYLGGQREGRREGRRKAGGSVMDGVSSGRAVKWGGVGGGFLMLAPGTAPSLHPSLLSFLLLHCRPSFCIVFFCSSTFSSSHFTNHLSFHISPPVATPTLAWLTLLNHTQKTRQLMAFSWCRSHRSGLWGAV